MSPVTVTASLRSPTASGKSIRTVRPVPIRTLSLRAGRKPLSSTSIRYDPGGSPEIENTPAELETACLGTPVARLVAVTVAAGTAPPAASVTSPVTWPAPTCARAVVAPPAISHAATHTQTSRAGIT